MTPDAHADVHLDDAGRRQFLLMLAFPVITVALFLLMFDRFFGTNFYNAGRRRRPAALAAPVLDLRPPRGLHPDPAGDGHRLRDPADVLAQAAVRLPGRWSTRASRSASSASACGRTTCSPSGMGPIADSVFALTTMLIAVPTGVKIFNWIGTMWGGSIRFTTPMLFAIGFVAMFTIGGLSGVMHASPPADLPADRHLLRRRPLPLRAVRRLDLRASSPASTTGSRSITGRLLNERLGKLHFWLMLHRLQPDVLPDAHPRACTACRAASTPTTTGMGWDFWNLIATIGAFIIALVDRSSSSSTLRDRASAAQVAGRRPVGRADARVDRSRRRRPSYNFAEIPVVHARRRRSGTRKYVEDEDGRPCRWSGRGAAATSDRRTTATTMATASGHGIHMPSPSYCPLVAALGPADHRRTGCIYWHAGSAHRRAAWSCWSALYGWALEPSAEPEEPRTVADAARRARDGARRPEHHTSTGLDNRKLRCGRSSARSACSSAR